MITQEFILKKLNVVSCGTVNNLFSRNEIMHFARKCLKNKNHDINEEQIVNDFIAFWENTKLECKRCPTCGKFFREGYRIEETAELYCSIKCLFKQ